jgi:hypothetical protein
VRAACKAEGGGRSHPCPSFSFLLRRAVLALTATTYYCTTMLRFSPYVAPPAAAIVHPVLSSSLSPLDLHSHTNRDGIASCVAQWGKRLPVSPVSPKLERERESNPRRLGPRFPVILPACLWAAWLNSRFVASSFARTTCCHRRAAHHQHSGI